MADLYPDDSPEYWLARLGAKLSARVARYDLLERYYIGDHPLPEGDERVRDFYRKFQRKARTNYCGLITDATVERIRFEGFRVGSMSADQDAGNELARRVWQANRMDAAAKLVHITGANLSDAYVIVGPPAKSGGMPVITAEDPKQVITEADPIDPTKILAGLKTWLDATTKTRHAIVYLPDEVHYFKANGSTTTFRPQSWEVEKPSVTNPPAEVTIVRFLPRPVGFAGDGLGEFEDCIDIQDRINDTVLSRMIVSKMQAYRQRWMTGGSVTDEDGEETKFYPGADLVWAVEDPNVKFGDFAQADLAPLLNAVKDDVTSIVNLSGLPPQYVAGGLVNVSADAVDATDSRQVDKCKDRMTYLGESWEQVHRLAFVWLGAADLIGDDAEVRWANPERRSVAQLADAAVKYQAAGVPWRARMRLLGFSDVEIDELEVERAEDTANGLMAPPAAPAVPPATPPTSPPPGPPPAPPK